MTMIIDGSAGATFPNSTTQASAGVVLQVVSVNSTAQQTTTSSSFVATNLTATITPKSATSKILVTYFVPVTNTTGSGTQVYHNIYRNNATQLLNGSTGQVVYELNATGYAWITAACSVYDSPATTSATTYTVYQKTTGGTAYFNYGSTMPNIIYLMEIAA